MRGKSLSCWAGLVEANTCLAKSIIPVHNMSRRIYDQ